MKKRVLVGMSGGVDSSVSAALLQDAGYEVIGASMEIWEQRDAQETGTGKGHGCYGAGEFRDLEDARQIAGLLEIPFYSIDIRKEYREQVIDYFTREYLEGRTPNPCTMCNWRIKFGYLPQKARESGIEFDFFATGHYARTGFNEALQRYELKKGIDEKKDQSYFLSFLRQHQLQMTMFPLGTYTKSEVRQLARFYNLPVNEKPESQDFIDRDSHATLFDEPPQPGQILDLEGRVRGTHRGIIYYTIGQRKGLGISARTPLYVLKIDKERNAIIVGPGEELYSSELIAEHINWILIDKLTEPALVKAKIRFAHKEAEAELFPLEGQRVRVRFKNPQMSVTPGQVVVFYKEESILGGGIIGEAGEKEGRLSPPI